MRVRGVRSEDCCIRDGGAGAAENTVTKAIRPVRMALAIIRISDINILSKYILRPLATARAVHRATIVGTLRKSVSPPIITKGRKPRASKALLSTLSPVQLESPVQFSIPHSVSLVAMELDHTPQPFNKTECGVYICLCLCTFVCSICRHIIQGNNIMLIYIYI